MITILAADSYKGYSAPMQNSREEPFVSAQPIFIGRVLWPGSKEPEDTVIKMYKAATCGTANEAIGYAANALRGVKQPSKGAILLLSRRELPKFDIELDEFIDEATGFTACWATSLEQNTTPFCFVRRLPSFSEKQIKAFYKSTFCHRLVTVDHVTGNNDRHEGNFLYADDLNYLAIDQGCIGGGLHWHTMWPDMNPKNTLLLLAKNTLKPSELSKWEADAIMEHERSQTAWPGNLDQIGAALEGILESDEIKTIVEYMRNRAIGTTFVASCGNLI